jgi:hypothetical protein
VTTPSGPASSYAPYIPEAFRDGAPPVDDGVVVEDLGHGEGKRVRRASR